MKNTTWKLKNEDEIDESHKSVNQSINLFVTTKQLNKLNFEYEVYLLNYTIKIKT